MEHAYVVLSILYNGVQVCVCVCVCVCVSVCECVLSLERHPASSGVRGADRWPQGHSSLWSVILSGDTNTSGKFHALFFSLRLVSLLFSPSRLSSVVFFLLPVSNSSLLSALLFVLSHRPPLLSCSLYNFLLIFLARVFASQTISSCVPVSLSLSLFPTVIHDLPAD